MNIYDIYVPTGRRPLLSFAGLGDFVDGTDSVLAVVEFVRKNSKRVVIYVTAKTQVVKHQRANKLAERIRQLGRTVSVHHGQASDERDAVCIQPHQKEEHK